MADELDLSRLAKLRELLDSELPQIVETLVEELTRALEGMRAALAGGDLAAAALAAHEARNSALMLNAEPMLNALREIEAAARVPDANRAQTGLGDLRPIWNALRARLDAEAQRAR